MSKEKCQYCDLDFDEADIDELLEHECFCTSHKHIPKRCDTCENYRIREIEIITKKGSQKGKIEECAIFQDMCKFYKIGCDDYEEHENHL